MGGDKVNCDEDCRMPTADMMLVKILLNSTISTEGACFMSCDVKNFYINTPLDHSEFVKIKNDNIPQEIIDKYEVRSMVCNDGYVYLKVNKEMYGLKQAALLAQQLIEKCLKEHGYSQRKLVPGLWTHE